MQKQKIGIALVLGSGGARGLAHIGVIKALEENEIPVNFIAGTSIGALIGGFYASGIDTGKLQNIVSEVDKILVARIFMPRLFASGFINNNKVREFIEGFVGDIKIENMKIPFAAIATDFITGEEVIFNKGLLVDAIMASIAIPAIFQPVLINHQYLIDGGLSNPLPVSLAKRIENNKVLAVNVSPNPKRITKKNKKKKTEELSSIIKKLPTVLIKLWDDNKRFLPYYDPENTTVKKKNAQLYSPTILNVFLQSVSISTNNLMTQQLRYAKPDVLINPNVEDFEMLDFYKGNEIIKSGYDAAIKALPEIKQLF